MVCLNSVVWLDEVEKDDFSHFLSMPNSSPTLCHKYDLYRVSLLVPALKVTVRYCTPQILMTFP